MADLPRYLGQALLYALFFIPLAYFTQQPNHRHLDDNMAVLKIAVRHAGDVDRKDLVVMWLVTGDGVNQDDFDRFRIVEAVSDSKVGYQSGRSH